MPTHPLLKRLLSEWLPALLLASLALGIWWYFNAASEREPVSLAACPTPLEIRLPGQQSGRYVACAPSELREVMRRVGGEQGNALQALLPLFESGVCPCRVTLSPDGAIAGLEEGVVSGSVALALGLPIDVNRASAADLEALPGVGPKVAQAIVEDRQRKGSFCSIRDLGRVKGIGEGFLERHGPSLQAYCP